MKRNNDNLISIDEFKKEKLVKKEEKSFSNYLRVLGFSELMNEASGVVKELNNSALNSDMAMRSSLILKEFGSRLKSESHEF